MTYQDFKVRWNGRRINYDGVYFYQCVDLILQYIADCYGITSGVWGNAIDYWYNPKAPLLQKFDKLATTNCQPGDIVVLFGLNGNIYGHIGICDHQDANNVWMFEQNGATGNGSGTGKDAPQVWRSVPKTRIAGILRPKPSQPAPPPVTPAPRVQTVFLPGSVRSWALYRVGSGLRKGTSDQIATLAPWQYGGLTYKIEGWVGDVAVIIQTQMFGRGVIWLKGTEAVIK